jgi:hypothetical protein
MVRPEELPKGFSFTWPGQLAGRAIFLGVEGEVYAIACHVIPDRTGGWIEDIRWARYIDRYRKNDGRWRFAKRVVTYDYVSQRPAQIEDGTIGDGSGDASYGELSQRLFGHGGRS